MEKMYKKNEQTLIQDDSPITSINEDKFGRRQFVENLANVLLPTKKNTESKVIALTGSWGVGKTSVINMVKNEIKKNMNNNKKLLIINFNPWQYAKNDDLIKPFLEKVALGCDDYEIKWNISKYYKSFDFNTLADYLKELVSIATSGTGFIVLKSFENYKKINQCVSSFGFVFFAILFFCSFIKILTTLFSCNLNTKKAKLLRSKKDISNSIRINDYHFLIIVDDIDRLTPEETLQMFRIIRTNADFANTTYLLAFDKNVVVENLNNTNVDGTGFVEKITTLEYQLFEPARFYLRKYLSDDIKQIFENLNISEKQKLSYFDNEEKYRFEKIIECMSETLKTMRDIKRYLNSLSLYSNIICPEGVLEVNFMDFAALECIHLKFADCYYGIQKNKELLTSSEKKIGQNKNIDIKSLVKNFAKSDIELRLVLILFPALNFEFRDEIKFGLPSNSEIESQQSRICSPKYFDKYFSSGINLDDPDHISNKELFEFESLSYDKNKMADFLRELLQTEKLTVFLELLKDVCTSKNFISKENASHFVATMFETECFEHYGHKIILERNNRDISKEIINSYLHQFITNEKLLKEIIVKAAEECECVYPIVAFIGGQVRAGENQSQEFLCAESDSGELKQIALQKLSNYKEKSPDKFWKDDDLLENIGYWYRLDAGNLKTAMKDDISTDEKLCEVMIKLYKKRCHKNQQKFPYDILGSFYDLENVKKRLEKALSEKSLNDDCTLIAEYFIKNFRFKDFMDSQSGDERLKRFDEEKSES